MRNSLKLIVVSLMVMTSAVSHGCANFLQNLAAELKRNLGTYVVIRPHHSGVFSITLSGRTPSSMIHIVNDGVLVCVTKEDDGNKKIVGYKMSPVMKERFSNLASVIVEEMYVSRNGVQISYTGKGDRYSVKYGDGTAIKNCHELALLGFLKKTDQVGKNKLVVEVGNWKLSLSRVEGWVSAYSNVSKTSSDAVSKAEAEQVSAKVTKLTDLLEKREQLQKEMDSENNPDGILELTEIEEKANAIFETLDTETMLKCLQGNPALLNKVTAMLEILPKPDASELKDIILNE